MTNQSGGGGASIPGMTSDNQDGIILVGVLQGVEPTSGIIYNATVDLQNLSWNYGPLEAPYAFFDGYKDNAEMYRMDIDGNLLLHGAVGFHGVAPPTVSRTLAQSVITAITDANAKTAVQAVANALADIGALTIT